MATEAGTGRHLVAAARPIGFWLKLADRLVDEQFEAALADFAVSRKQWEILNVLSPGPSTLLNLNLALEPFLDLDIRESAADHVSELIERGWVDVAFEYYELTGEGASRHAELHRRVAKNRSRALDGIIEEDFATTVQVLERVAKNLGWNG
jgi:DNA-binding MarR family transcriptional regulator